MAKKAEIIADGLGARARGLDAYLHRVEGLFDAGDLPRADVHRAYAGAFLSFYVDLERAVEDLFMGLVMGRVIHSNTTVRSLVVIQSEVVARKVVRGERRYVDWLPYRLTRDRAKAFLSRGQPFASLTDRQALPLERIRIVRNALAHGGDHAMRQFHNTFTDGLSLPADQRRPAGYLRGQHAVNQTRFAYLLADAVGVAKSLT